MCRVLGLAAAFSAATPSRVHGALRGAVVLVTQGAMRLAFAWQQRQTRPDTPPWDDTDDDAGDFAIEMSPLPTDVYTETKAGLPVRGVKTALYADLQWFAYFFVLLGLPGSLCSTTGAHSS